jgi:hypothetical protein
MTTAGQTLNELRTNPRSAKQLWWQRLRACWNAALGAVIPVGYEDKTGFHYGADPASDFRRQDR